MQLSLLELLDIETSFMKEGMYLFLLIIELLPTQNFAYLKHDSSSLTCRHPKQTGTSTDNPVDTFYLEKGHKNFFFEYVICTQALVKTTSFRPPRPCADSARPEKPIFS